MIINNDIELETSAPIVPISKFDTDIIDNNDTIKALEELAKTLQMTEISDLYPLLTKTNHTKFVNYASISDMVCEVFISICKTTTGIDNLVNNNYLSIYKLLKYVLIDTSTTKSVIKRSYVSNKLLRKKLVIHISKKIVAIF